MNELELLLGLSERMRKVFDGYTVLITRKKDEPNEAGEYEYEDVPYEVKVQTQYMPQPEGITWSDEIHGLDAYGESEYEKNFPCVVVKLGTRTDYQNSNREMSQVSVRMIAGVYDPAEGCQGYREALNIMIRARQELLRDKEIQRRFRLMMPVKTKILEADTWPVYFVEMELMYECAMWQMGHEYVYGRSVCNGSGRIYAGSHESE